MKGTLKAIPKTKPPRQKGFSNVFVELCRASPRNRKFRPYHLYKQRIDIRRYRSIVPLCREEEEIVKTTQKRGVLEKRTSSFQGGLFLFCARAIISYVCCSPQPKRRKPRHSRKNRKEGSLRAWDSLGVSSKTPPNQPLSGPRSHKLVIWGCNSGSSR